MPTKPRYSKVMPYILGIEVKKESIPTNIKTKNIIVGLAFISETK